MVERVFVRHEIRKRRGTSGQGSDRRRRCRQRTENRAGNEGVNDKEIHREETRLSLIIWINRAYFTRVGLFRRAISAQKQDRLKFHRGRSLVYRHLTTFALSSGNNEKKILSSRIPSSREYRRIRHSRHFYFLRTWSREPLIKNIAFRSLVYQDAMKS